MWKVTKEANDEELDSFRYAGTSAALAKRGHVQRGTGLMDGETACLYKNPWTSYKKENTPG